METVHVNTIEWASEICHFFIEKLEEVTSNKYITVSAYDPDITIYTDEGQDIFNDMYDQVIDYIETGLHTTHKNHNLDITFYTDGQL